MRIPVPLLRSLPGTLFLLVICGGAAISALAQGQEMEAASLAVGDEALGFELATFGNGQVSLQQYLGNDGKSVVLTFARAHW